MFRDNEIFISVLENSHKLFTLIINSELSREHAFRVHIKYMIPNSAMNGSIDSIVADFHCFAFESTVKNP